MLLWFAFLVALVYVVWRSGLIEVKMGNKSSSRRRSMSSYDRASSQNYGFPPPSPYASQPGYAPQTPHTSHHPQYAPSPLPQSYAPPPSATRPKKTLERKYSRIADNYRTLDEVTAALAQAGLESSNLIVGIDFTKSNEWTASTHDQDVFSFYDEDRCCQGFEEVLSRYRELVPQLRLAGPTSFAPVIEMAMTIVEQSGGQYHVLLIIADGQVTRSVDTQQGNLSPQEQKTIEAIVQASAYPLSIVLVGVGDGPWDMMREFDDNIPARAFDNFQFVNFTQIMSKNLDPSKKQTEFALSALMEIPSQYKATLEHGILGRRTGHCPERVCLPPPQYNAAAGRSGSNSYSRANSFQKSAPTYPYPGAGLGTSSSSTPAYSSTAPPSASPYSSTTPPSTSANENQLCPICITSPKNMAFGCGHQTCCDCGEFLDSCPICRRSIETRIRLY
uniref:RING-type domain-containing protein n=1 Tax=Chenopodium quinoa TaxID=63459 RepID=A0A803M709_CHEQI